MKGSKSEIRYGQSRRRWRVLALLFVLSSVTLAQMNDAPDIHTLLSQQDDLRARRAKLEAELSDVIRQYQADPHAALREEIWSHEQFVAELQHTRIAAARFSTPELAQAFDWNVAYVTQKIAALRRELTSRERASRAEKSTLHKQMEEKRRDIALNTRLQKVLDATVQEMQEQQRREAVASELEAIEGTTRSSVVSPTSIGGIISNQVLEPQKPPDPTPARKQPADARRPLSK